MPRSPGSASLSGGGSQASVASSNAFCRWRSSVRSLWRVREAVGGQRRRRQGDHDRHRDVDARIERPDGLLQSLESDQGNAEGGDPGDPGARGLAGQRSHGPSRW